MEDNNNFNSNDEKNIDIIKVITVLNTEKDKISITKDNHNSNLNTNDINDDAIQQQNNPHNGCDIDEIKYSPNLKFLVTHSRNDSSIVEWTIDNNGTIQPNDRIEYSKGDFKKNEFNRAKYNSKG